MPSISAEDLRERLERDMPGSVVPVERPADEPAKPAHQKERPNLLLTYDTVVDAGRIVEAALYLRDKLGYSFLSDIAAVDYLADGLIELVYRFYHPAGGDELVLKVRLPRNKPQVASLTPAWPGAGLHEREAFDLFGVVFTGHPYLKRIYMWDEFAGFPMRKDFPKQGDKYMGEE